jgi:uncharacterized protein YbjT (DUF2867 family)
LSEQRMASKPARIAVDGATGYIGTHLVDYLARKGVPVRSLVRPQASREDLSFLQALGSEVVAIDLFGNSNQSGALTGVETVVHLIGSIAPPRGQTLSDLHQRQTATLVQACKEAGVRKIVMVSALGTARGAASTYHATKWEAEECIRTSALAYVILRPSLIVGRSVGRRNSKLVSRYLELARTRPRVPLIGGGRNMIQPVYIGNLVEAIVQSIESKHFDGMTLEIGGSQTMSMREFVQELMSVAGINKTFLDIPPFLANPVAALLESVQTVPLLSRDQIRLAGIDNICRENALIDRFNISPLPLKEALAAYAATTPPQ